MSRQSLAVNPNGALTGTICGATAIVPTSAGPLISWPLKVVVVSTGLPLTVMVMVSGPAGFLTAYLVVISIFALPAGSFFLALICVRMISNRLYS